MSPQSVSAKQLIVINLSHGASQARETGWWDAKEGMRKCVDEEWQTSSMSGCKVRGGYLHYLNEHSAFVISAFIMLMEFILWGMIRHRESAALMCTVLRLFSNTLKLRCIVRHCSRILSVFQADVSFYNALITSDLLHESQMTLLALQLATKYLIQFKIVCHKVYITKRASKHGCSICTQWKIRPEKWTQKVFWKTMVTVQYPAYVH